MFERAPGEQKSILKKVNAVVSQIHTACERNRFKRPLLPESAILEAEVKGLIESIRQENAMTDDEFKAINRLLDNNLTRLQAGSSLQVTPDYIVKGALAGLFVGLLAAKKLELSTDDVYSDMYYFSIVSAFVGAGAGYVGSRFFSRDRYEVDAGTRYYGQLLDSIKSEVFELDPSFHPIPY